MNRRMSLSKRAVISQDRINMCNPYAHLDEEGELDADIELIINPDLIRNSQYKRTYSDYQVRKVVRTLHEFLWENKQLLWAGEGIPKPEKMLDPQFVIEKTGYRVGRHTNLGMLSAGMKKPHRVAALINKKEKLIHVSDEFPFGAQNFMLAHELGHLVLHDRNALHKDVYSFSEVKPRIEREADLFAAEFLMPKKLISNYFWKLYDREFYLVDELSHALESKKGGITELARELALANKVGGKFLKRSMSRIFDVSGQAMGLRLIELKLIR